MGGGSIAICALASFIGAVTATGSIVAFLKLNGNLSPSPLQLPGRDLINIAMLVLCLSFGLNMYEPEILSSVSPQLAQLFTGEISLISISLIAGILGAHLTSSIGGELTSIKLILRLMSSISHPSNLIGADMPVVITVLNSYSGWALCAEGFLLNNELLTSVGALIGFSGAILTKIMCDAMNRNVISVVLGGAGTVSSSAAKTTGLAQPTSV
jgi:NAD(P) transhydrogenase